MQIHFFEELDSTSNKASELISQGHKAPFVVIADKQTAGRGRRGNHWVSESGNIFATFVMHPPGDPLKQMGLLPIKSAVVLSQWLHETFGFRPTIKWPNDILFAGCKIAGILCESSTQGKSWGLLSIGIGINVKCSPIQGLEYQSSNLDLISRVDLDFHHVRDSLIEFWPQRWSEIKDAEIVEEFKKFSIEDGQPWIQKDGSRVLFGNGLDVDGSLRLLDLKQNTTQSLASVSHDFNWAYQKRYNSSAPLLIADIGNTAAKIYIFKNYLDQVPVKEIIVDFKDVHLSQHIRNELQLLNSIVPMNTGMWPIYCVSVNSTHFDKLAMICSETKFVLWKTPKRPIRYKPMNYNLNQLGIDRLALMEGWLSRNYRDGGWGKLGVLVSLGTATTIDVINDSGAHCGGFILPGIQTGLLALHHGTALLPNLNSEELISLHSFLGTDTRTAMLLGMRAMTESVIDSTIEKLKSENHHTPIEVCVVGGYANCIKNYNNTGYINYNLLGMKSMVLGGELE